MKLLSIRDKLLSPALFLVTAAAVVLTLFGVSRALGKTVDVDDFDCFGTLKVQSVVYCADEKLNSGTADSDSFAVTVTDKVFEDLQSGEKFEKPIYRFKSGAFEVENGKTCAVLSFFADKKPNLKKTFDFSQYKTRTALSVLTKKQQDTGFVIYRCIDKLGNTDLFLCRFEKQSDGSQTADALFKLSKNPSQSLSPSEIGLCGSFSLGENAYKAAPGKSMDKADFSSLKINVSDSLFLCGEAKITNPKLVLKENAFCKRGKKDAAIMYYVGNRWDKTNSVYLPSCKSAVAYDVTDENGEKSGFVIYVFEDENASKEFWQGMFNYSSDYPPFSQYFSILQKQG